MKMKVVAFEPQPDGRGSLKGHATILFTKIGLKVSSIRYYQRDREDWVHLPCRRKRSDNGEVRWIPNVSFSNSQEHSLFLDELADLIADYRKEWPHE